MQDKESGSFINGFGIGILTGVAAYFLFGTEQGKELRTKILSEWESTQTTLKDEVGIEPPKQLKQVITGVLRHFSQVLQEVEVVQEKTTKKAAQTRSKIEAKPRTGSRFKGV